MKRINTLENKKKSDQFKLEKVIAKSKRGNKIRNNKDSDSDGETSNIQKQPLRGVPRQRCSENMQ